MFYLIFSKLKEWLSSRMIPIVIFYFVLAGVLIFQMYRIQILDAEQVVAKEEYKQTRDWGFFFYRYCQNMSSLITSAMVLRMTVKSPAVNPL